MELSYTATGTTQDGARGSPLRFFERICLKLTGLSWKLVVGIIMFHYFSSWALMYYFESGAEFSQPAVYWWFYIVTSTTVGYGDFSPATLGGRIVAVYVMLGGIGFFAAFIAKVAEGVFSISPLKA